MSGIRHFLEIDDFDAATLRRLLNDARDFKAGALDGKPLAGRTLAMVFEKPSTRTRVSFEVAMRQLGGDAIVLEQASSQLGRGETMADTARVLSRYVDAIMLRTTEQAGLMEMAEHASVPVINGLTDQSHPCQIMADIMTFEEHRGPIGGRTVAWVGDGNNVARTWVQAAVPFGFTVHLSSPAALSVPDDLVARAVAGGARVERFDDPRDAVRGVDCVVTDTWVSMGDDAANRHNLLVPYRVDEALMATAGSQAIFMHCLPAHRGDEVTDGVMDGPQSVVWDEAENRMHAQKSILNWCLADQPQRGTRA
jgi:ornithine carbamoyltransferase